MLFPERFRHNRQRKQAEHILFIRLAQLNAHGQGGNGAHRCAFIHNAELGYAFGHKFMKRKGHIAGLNRRAIVKTGPGVERNFGPGEVIRVADIISNQRIVAAGFIIGGHKKRIVKGFRSRRRDATQGEAVKVVKCSRGGERDLSAFGGGRIDVIEVRKIDRVLWLANHGERDVFFDGLRLARQAC